MIFVIISPRADYSIFQKKFAIDRESEAELRDLYGDVGYTIIDDVMSLPERMPNIYRRLTS
jgi:nitric oxide reductase activation protein